YHRGNAGPGRPRRSRRRRHACPPGLARPDPGWHDRPRPWALSRPSFLLTYNWGAVNLRKTFFILPNMFTLASVFCGFFSLTLSASADPKQSDSILQLYQAALAICAGFFFDTFDGRIARLTRTQSQLGLQLDSLADVITFGAAPAML